MASDVLEDISTWFQNYVETFYSGNTQSISMIKLKFQHSLHVADNCRSLSKELCWSEININAAEITGLLHEIDCGD